MYVCTSVCTYACMYVCNVCMYVLCVCVCVCVCVHGGADKSLAKPTFRCRRTKLIVSLERGACLCVEIQVFSCYVFLLCLVQSLKEACQATRAISTTSRHELSSSFFPTRQGAKGNSRYSDGNIRGTCTIVCHRQKLGGPV